MLERINWADMLLFVVVVVVVVLIKDEMIFYTLCPKKNDTDVAHYNFNAHQPISLIFGVDIAE